MDEEEKNENSEEKKEPINETIEEVKQEEAPKDEEVKEVPPEPEKTEEPKKEERSKLSEEAENIKNETKDTVNKVKDTIKNTDFKKDANETTNFVKEMFLSPIEAVRRAASEESILGKAVILMIVYIAATVLSTVLLLFKSGNLFSFGYNFMRFVLSFFKPILAVLVPSIVIYFFTRDNKKKLVTVLSTIVVAKIPDIISAVLKIIDILIIKITLITSPVEKTLAAVAIILTYFGYKELSGKGDDTNLIKKYAIILLISQAIFVLLNEIGIYTF